MPRLPAIFFSFSLGIIDRTTEIQAYSSWLPSTPVSLFCEVFGYLKAARFINQFVLDGFGLELDCVGDGGNDRAGKMLFFFACF